MENFEISQPRNSTSGSSHSRQRSITIIFLVSSLSLSLKLSYLSYLLLFGGGKQNSQYLGKKV